MRNEDPQGEAALRYDRWGTRRGLPYAADPAWDDPPARAAAPDADAWTGGAGGGWTGPANRWDEPGRRTDPSIRSIRRATPGGGWDVGGGGSGADIGLDGDGADDDGYALDAVPLYGGPWLPPRVWARWRRRPWFPRFHGMLRRARPAGVLRHRRTGARYPVFRGRIGGRGWRVVTRPRGGMRFEVVGLEAETGLPTEAGNEAESEMLALPGAGASTSSGYAPDDRTSRPGGGYRLRLPHQGIHTILARLRPEQLRALAGGPLPADPTASVVRGVGRVARRARRLGRFRGRRGGPRLDLFGIPGFRLLVRPTGEMEGEILAVTPVAGELEEETRQSRSIQGTMTWYGPYRFVANGPEVLTTIPGGPPLKNVTGKGVYLLEKRGNQGYVPILVGQADTSFQQRLGTRRDYFRQGKVDLARYRVYLGVPSSGTADLFALEHAVIRSVMRGTAGASAGATDKQTAENVPIGTLTNATSTRPFQVAGAGLNLVHRQAPGHSRPSYLRSGTGAAGLWYELPE